MSTESILRKEGIEVVKQLDTARVNLIAQKITNRLCSAFPEHGFSRAELFASIARLPMYLAKMTDNLCGAKYFYKNNSIYFNIDYSLAEVDSFSLHECLHYLQEVKDEKGNLIRLGLYDFAEDHGMALNEAAVQLITVEALGEPVQNVTYYGLSIPCPSPNSYPLECAIVSQMAYFTGTYPLYYSALHGNDIFKNTFITIVGEKAFYQIETNLDKMLSLENELSSYIDLLTTFEGNIRKIKKINSCIEHIKKEISNLFLACQNTMISHCFSREVENIRDLEDVTKVKTKLYEFQHYIATNETYTFYNEFYRHMMEALEEKAQSIKEHGTLEKVLTSDMTVVSNVKGGFALFHRILTRLGWLKQRGF